MPFAKSFFVMGELFSTSRLLFGIRDSILLACLLSRLVHKWRTQGTHLLPQVGPCLLVKHLVDDHPPFDDDNHARCITMGLCLWTISTLWPTCTSSRAG